MRIAVVDDDPAMRQELADYIERFGREAGEQLETAAFSSADELLNGYKPTHDVILFDIDMPGTNGMDAARTLRTMDQRTAILFITNIAQYAINGYEVDAVDYIIKPIGYYDFAMKFQKALRRAKRPTEQWLAINTTDGPARVNVMDIYYVEASGHYLVYHTKDRSIRVRASLREQEAELQKYNFRRIHKSFLINLLHLENIYQADVIVAGEKLPLGRAHRDSVVNDFMRFLRD